MLRKRNRLKILIVVSTTFLLYWATGFGFVIAAETQSS